MSLQIVSALFGIFGVVLALYVFSLMKKRNPKRWMKFFPPEGIDRGPNADSSYNMVILGEKGSLFTDEEVAESQHRYFKYVGKQN